jgi:hypothetical protein
MNTTTIAKTLNEPFPNPTGYKSFKSTLCIGLDIAWFGGSKNNLDSQYDCLTSTIIRLGEKSILQCDRVKLVGRDPDAGLIAEAIRYRVDERNDVEQVVLAIDAPLQTTQGAPPSPQKKAFRGCERHFNECRKRIDRAAGGSRGWQPNVQPGVPLAPRVQELLKKLQGYNFKLWSEQTAEDKKLVIECFPAEGIWAAKRLGHYAECMTATCVKAYKNQNGIRLSAAQVRKVVNDAMRDAFVFLPGGWPHLVDQITAWMLEDKTWQRDGNYCGGKLLDDVVDSMISLATALSYANGKAHIWQDPDNPDDGHIIGPGCFIHLSGGA